MLFRTCLYTVFEKLGFDIALYSERIRGASRTWGHGGKEKRIPLSSFDRTYIILFKYEL